MTSDKRYKLHSGMRCLLLTWGKKWGFLPAITAIVALFFA